MRSPDGPGRAAAEVPGRGEGALIVIVGPSGAGKDTLINWLRTRLDDDRDILFVRRTVTRAAHPSLEDHDAMSAEAFAKAEAEGRFCFTWEAHGLRYGLPSALADHLRGGGTAIANGSRRTLPALCRRFRNMTVVNITVERSILAARLAARGRECAEEIAARLARTGIEMNPDCELVHLDNSGSVPAAGEALLALVRTRAGRAAGGLPAR